MAAWDKEVHRVEHRRWTLAMPAHHTDVASAVMVASRDRDQAATGGSHVTDVVVTAEDELLVVFYTVRLKPTFAQTFAQGGRTDGRDDAQAP